MGAPEILASSPDASSRDGYLGECSPRLCAPPLFDELQRITANSENLKRHPRGWGTNPWILRHRARKMIFMRR